MEVAPFFVDFHHFLSIFTIYALLSRFTFCRDLRTFSANFFWPKQPSPQHHTFFACMPLCFFWILSGPFFGTPGLFQIFVMFLHYSTRTRWQRGKKDHRSKCYLMNNYLMFYLYKKYISIYFNLYSLFFILPPGDWRANKGTAANITCWSISPHPTLFQYIHPMSSFFSSSPSLSSW